MVVKRSGSLISSQNRTLVSECGFTWYKSKCFICQLTEPHKLAFYLNHLNHDNEKDSLYRVTESNEPGTIVR